MRMKIDRIKFNDNKNAKLLFLVIFVVGTLLMNIWFSLILTVGIGSILWLSYLIRKKEKNKIIFPIAIILTMITSIYLVTYFFVPGLFYRLFYFEDRVKITTNIYVDNEKVEIDKNSIEITGDGVGKTHLNDTDKGFKISFKGNQHSRYKIDLKAKDYNFNIMISHFNWWDVFSIDLRIDIDTKDNKITYSISNKYISEDKGYREDTIKETKTKELSEINEIWI